MNEHAEMAEQIYFANNGAIDLLTGAISQSRFDQIVKRDLQLSHRNQNQLIIISIRVNLNNYFADQSRFLLIRFQLQFLSALPQFDY